MTDWHRKIAPVVRAVEKRYDALKYRLYYALGGPGPIRIQPYRGYGTEERLYLQGRVLEERGVTRPSKTDNWWNNLVNMYRRLHSREVPHAQLVARFDGVEQEVKADEEGMFEVWIEPRRPLRDGERWQSVELELIEPLSDQQEGPVRATGQVLVPPSDAPFGVISDIDDTVIQSDIGSFLEMVGTFLFSNARTRLPLPGVAAFYRALYEGPEGDARTPMFYVSNGLWNLYDLLEDFFRLHEIPGGPVLLLRNWGVYRDELLPTRQRAHKLGLVRPIMDLYPDLPFILIGDSGEADPEIYHELVEEYGDRILAVYIRNVSHDLERSKVIRALANEIAEAGSDLVLADDSLAMARHAAEEGLIRNETLSGIGAEQARERSEARDAERELSAENSRHEIRAEGGVNDDGIQATVRRAGDEEIPTVIAEPEEEG